MTETMTVTLDRGDHATVVAALVHYAMHVAMPEGVVRALNAVQPDPKQPWEEIVEEARLKFRQVLDKAEGAAS